MLPSAVFAPDLALLVSANVDSDIDTTPLNVGGTHYVLLGNNQVTAAAYDFRLFEENSAPALTLGEQVSGNIPTGRETTAFTFTATSGQQFFYDGRDNDFDAVNAQLIGPGDVLAFQSQF